MSQPTPHIFLVDDDPELRQLTADYLSGYGLTVTCLASGDELLRRLPRLRPDLVVLDVMMPGTDGFAVCRRLREAKDDIPILMLTARGDDVDRIIGLEFGADDYLAKPFNPRELVARIHAVLRRRLPLPGMARPDRERLRFGECELDFAARRLLRDGLEQPLSSGEFALLVALVEHAPRPLSRERLLELSRANGDELGERSIDVAVHRLRRLVESDPSQPRYLQTVRGLGYAFVPDRDS